MSARLQNWIYFIEEGKGAKIILSAVAVLGFIALAVLYDIGSFKNFDTEEAMDLSQLARNIASSEGYTTDYIRPLSMNLINATANQKLAALDAKLKQEGLSATEKKETEAKSEELRKTISWKTRQPDLAHAPVYPALLAGFLKVVPVEYPISKKKAFSTYTPEFWIAVFNQIIFFLAVILLFKITRQLFDRAVAITSAALFAATELFWHFSIAGIPSMLMLLIFLGIAFSLVKFHVASDSSVKSVLWAVLAGILVGIGCLTRYSFGWLIGPVLLFILLFGTAHRARSGALAILAFVAVISPWLARNESLSGNLFGTASYAICENTPKFQEDRLERSLDRSSPFKKVFFPDYVRKFMENSRQIFGEKLPHLGANWLTFFFFVGWLIPLQTRAQSRLRLFLLFSLLFLWFVEALGRTHLTVDSPIFTSENLLVITTPLIFVFGVAAYYDLLRRIVFSEPILPYAATLVFSVLISAPLIFTLLPPATNPSGYPPYYPPIIQETSSWMRKNELVMSDIPWAVAWYGNRQGTPLTLTYPKDFLKLNDDIRPVQALYLTPRTTDKRFLSEMIKDRESWGRFVLENLSKGQVPDGFPLKKAPSGFLPDQVFLTDWERWTLTRK